MLIVAMAENLRCRADDRKQINDRALG